jgi:CDP-diacylglycerol--serine O-phosphatidyltransferase
MFSIPNILTSGNLLAGILSILFSLQGRIDIAVYCLLVSMTLDFFDGFLARLLKQHSELGKQLDSLADMVSFGVAPGVLVFVLFIVSGAMQLTGLLAEELLYPMLGTSLKSLIDLYFKHLIYGPEVGDVFIFQGWPLVLPIVAILIPFFSLFRLAKFNLDKRQSEQFIGLPTPANTLFFMGIALTLWFGLKSESIGAILAEILVGEQVLMTLVVLFSFLLIAELPLIALKFKNFEFQQNWDKYVLLVGGALIVVLLRQFALTFIVLLYIVLSIIRFFFNKSTRHEIQS